MFSAKSMGGLSGLPNSLNKNLTLDIIAMSDNIHKTKPAESIKQTDLYRFSCKTIHEVIDIPDFPKGHEDRKYNCLILIALYGSNIEEISAGLSGLQITSSLLLLDPFHNQTLIDSLNREGITIQRVDGEDFLTALYNLIPASLQEKYERIMEMEPARVQRVALAVYGPYYCLLGKKLNLNNWNRWGERVIKAMFNSVGISSAEEEVGLIYPTLRMSSTYHDSVSSKLPLKSGIYRGLKALESNSNLASHIRTYAGAILSRLSFTDLGNFRLIDTYIVRTNLYMLLWGWIAESLSDLRTAYARYEEFAEDGPFLKLITSPNDCPEFSTVNMKKLAEIARIIGILMGQAQLSQVTTGYKFDNEELIRSKLENLMSAGANALYVWSSTAGTYIARPSENIELYKALRGESEPSVKPVPPNPSAPPHVIEN